MFTVFAMFPNGYKIKLMVFNHGYYGAAMDYADSELKKIRVDGVVCVVFQDEHGPVYVANGKERLKQSFI